MARYKLVVIGASAGGLTAIEKLLAPLPKDFGIPIVIVQHISPDSENYMVTLLNNNLALRVKEADEKEVVKPGTVYIAPPNFHVFIEEDLSITLSVEERVNFSRPSIDVLFETAAISIGNQVVGIVLTGGNQDGAMGLKMIKDRGGLTIVQSAEEAQVAIMPSIAIKTSHPDYVLTLSEISDLLLRVAGDFNSI